MSKGLARVLDVAGDVRVCPGDIQLDESLVALGPAEGWS